MTTLVKHLQEQTAIRLQLLENGYRPLPAKEKMVVRKGWPTMPVDRDVVLSWKNDARDLTTAIQITGDLVAMDFDIDDPGVDELIEWCDEHVPGFSGSMTRAGKGNKLMMMARVDEPFAVITSSTFCRGGDVEDRHRFEAFSGKTSRYFSCFGPHTLGDRPMEFKVVYEWLTDATPMNTRPEDLPVIAKADILKIANRASELMERLGWEKHRRAGSGELSGKPVFDITPEMIFECEDGEDRSYDELAAYSDSGHARCSASWLEEGARNRTRCRIAVDGYGMAYVFDHADWCKHYPVGGERRPASHTEASAKMREALARLDAKMAASLAPKAEGEGAPVALAGQEEEEEFDDLVLRLLDSYAFYPEGLGGEQVVSLLDPKAGGMSLGSFKLLHAPYEIEVTGPRGGQSKLNAATVWSRSRDRLVIDGKDFIPEDPSPIVVTPEGRRLLNTYRPPFWGDAQAHSIEVWDSFIEHLLPDEEEREWFLNWLSYKAQNPGARGAGVVMVSPELQGVGRGTLFAILTGVFGYSRKVTSSNLLGVGGQSAYNEWQADTLFAFCDEVTAPDPSLAAKRIAYDRLKELVDPGAGMITVNTKYGKARQTICRASIMIASNSLGALPIDAHDRRFAVLMNGPVPLERNAGLTEHINRLRDDVGFDRGFLKAIYEQLLATPTMVQDFLVPIATELKVEMAQQSEGLIKGMIEEVLAHNEEGLISSVKLAARVEGMITAKGYPVAVKMAAAREVNALLAGRGAFHGWHRTGKWNIAKGTSRTFYHREEDLHADDRPVWTLEQAEAHVGGLSMKERAAIG